MVRPLLSPLKRTLLSSLQLLQIRSESCVLISLPVLLWHMMLLPLPTLQPLHALLQFYLVVPSRTELVADLSGASTVAHEVPVDAP